MCPLIRIHVYGEGRKQVRAKDRQRWRKCLRNQREKGAATPSYWHTSGGVLWQQWLDLLSEQKVKHQKLGFQVQQSFFKRSVVHWKWLLAQLWLSFQGRLPPSLHDMCMFAVILQPSTSLPHSRSKWSCDLNHINEHDGETCKLHCLWHAIGSGSSNRSSKRPCVTWSLNGSCHIQVQFNLVWNDFAVSKL